MRPRNKREKEVVALSESLPGLSEAQERWFIDKVVERRVYTTGRKAWCTACGKEFEVGPEDGKKRSVECPHCHKKGKLVKSRKTTLKDAHYAQILTTCEGWQVIRYYWVEWNCRKGEEQLVYWREVMQKWCRPGEKMITIGANIVPFPYSARCPFSVWTPKFSVKEGTAYHYEWMKVKIFPARRILQEYKRCGYSGKIYDCAETTFGMVFSNPFFEMLYKQQKYKLLDEAIDKEWMVRKYWQSIRVALRHHFEFVSLRDYLDYCRILENLGYDLHNPKYVAPDDWVEMHDRILTQYERKQARERAERERRDEEERLHHIEMKLKTAVEQNEAYAKRIARYATLDITDGVVDIRPLMTIQEFADEGREMHHCVFANEYYMEKNSLILSAKVEGKRVETIEVDLIEFKVRQSRGKHNVESPRHGEIVDLMNANMSMIRKMTKRRVKPTAVIAAA